MLSVGSSCSKNCVKLMWPSVKKVGLVLVVVVRVTSFKLLNDLDSFITLILNNQMLKLTPQ